MLAIKMPGDTYDGPFLPLTADELTIRQHLERHIYKLAGDIGERNMDHYPQLLKAADYIENAFKEAGYSVTTQAYDVEGKTVKNLIAEHQGQNKAHEIIIVGAHYDSIFGATGADDNASGVAAVLEIARFLAKQKLARTVRFVAFANEEPPYFQTQVMGSWQYAQQAKMRNENIVAMFSLETIGFYSDQPNSQQYPFPFNYFYPNRGNFIGFVGNFSSRELVRKSIATFRRTTLFPSQGVAAPGWIIGVSWSDQSAFWDQGYPAIMITDTALFRNPYYHTKRDKPETIDYDRSARVVRGLAEVVIDRANL